MWYGLKHSGISYSQTDSIWWYGLKHSGIKLLTVFCFMYFQVLEISANIFKQIPENIDYDQTAKILSVDPSPLNVVLLQEVN